MAAYLTIVELKTLANIPAAHVDRCEAVAPGYVQGQLDAWSRYIDSRLRKRYAAVMPFAPPYPIELQSWLARIVAVRIETKIGIRPTDEQFVWLEGDAKGAFTELEEAANSETGLFDLPKAGGANESGLGQGGSRVYSEQSPYVGFDRQSQVARSEDNARYGSNK